MINTGFWQLILNLVKKNLAIIYMYYLWYTQKAYMCAAGKALIGMYFCYRIVNIQSTFDGSNSLGPSVPVRPIDGFDGYLD